MVDDTSEPTSCKAPVNSSRRAETVSSVSPVNPLSASHSGVSLLPSCFFDLGVGVDVLGFGHFGRLRCDCESVDLGLDAHQQLLLGSALDDVLPLCSAYLKLYLCHLCFEKSDKLHMLFLLSCHCLLVA